MYWLHHPDGGGITPFSDSDAGQIILTDIVSASAIAFILAVRGWRLSDFGARVTLPQVIAGIPLHWIDWALTLLVVSIMVVDLGGDFGTLFGPVEPEDQLSTPVALIFAVCNPIQEEVFVVGYVVGALRPRYGARVAILASTLIRLSYHLYQGGWAIPNILPMGLLYAFLYCRWRRLTPLIVAHFLHNVQMADL